MRMPFADDVKRHAPPAPRRRARLALACALALLAVSGSAMAQRVSLADRVSALERQNAAATGQAGQANVELLNRLTQVQSEVQALRNQVEQLQKENAELRQSNKNRYQDLDGRLQRLEGGAPAGSSSIGATAPGPAPGGLVNRLPPGAAPPSPVLVGPAGPAGPVDPAGERVAYDSAFASLRAGDYVTSARAFQAYLRDYPDGALAPNAWYWLGESYYVTQNYPIALQSFDTLLQRFPGATKAPDAMLKRGFALIELGQTGPGTAALERLVGEYPGSDAARLAASRLRTLQLQGR
jgi:tol-pal system protein YbgF